MADTCIGNTGRPPNDQLSEISQFGHRSEPLVGDRLASQMKCLNFPLRPQFPKDVVERPGQIVRGSCHAFLDIHKEADVDDFAHVLITEPALYEAWLRRSLLRDQGSPARLPDGVTGR